MVSNKSKAVVGTVVVVGAAFSLYASLRRPRNRVIRVDSAPKIKGEYCNLARDAGQLPYVDFW